MKKIRIVRRRNNTGAGGGMYRAWCETCQDHLRGQARSRYQSYWQTRAGAERAAQAHQDEHTARTQFGFALAKDGVPPNDSTHEEVTSIPVKVPTKHV